MRHAFKQARTHGRFALIACCAAIAGTYAWADASRGVVLGNYVVPAMEGWQRTTFDSKVLSSVTFTKSVGGERLVLKVMLSRIPKGIRTKQIAVQPQPTDIRRVLEGPGGKVRTLTQHPATFLGRRGYRTLVELDEHGDQVVASVLSFRDGRDDYTISGSASGKQVSRRVRHILDQALAELIRGMARATNERPGALRPANGNTPA